MYETLKMMKSIITGEESKTDEKKLIETYKENLFPNILAYLYINNFGIISKTAELYPKLDDMDKASFCLQELDSCLQNYNSDKNTKFITFFIKCYKNRLRMETQRIMANKRKSFLFVQNLSEINNIGNDYLDYQDIELILNNYNLTTVEKKYCKLLNEGYSIKEIADKVYLKPISIYKKLTIIKQKILISNINFV